MPRILSTLALVTVLLSGLVVESAAATPTPTLTGKVVLRGSQSAGALVEVPAGAALDFHQPSDEIPALSVDGPGRIVGFLLRNPTTSDYFLAYRLPSAVIGTHYQALSQVGGSTCFLTTCPIPPGRYELYLIGDGSKTQVTMNVVGLEGTKQFCTAGSCSDDADAAGLSPVESQVETPAASTDFAQQPGLAVRSAGSSVTMKSRGLLLGLGWGTGTSSTLPPPASLGTIAHAEHGLCVYDGTPPDQGFQPVCPDSQTPLPTIAVTTIGTPYGYIDSWTDTHPSLGAHSIGAYQAVAGTADGFGMAMLRLEALQP